MEHAPLRPVPARPAGPVDPAAAASEVAAALPALSPLEARALAFVALAERPRVEVAGRLGIEERELGAVLAGARKELRRTIAPLGGSGWCERAELLISDRLDDVLHERDTRRLDVHLRNCPRCVEHERRLVQATDALLAGLAPAVPARPRPGLEPTEPTLEPAEPDRDEPPAPLVAVPPEGAEPEDAPPAPAAAPAPPAAPPESPSSAEIAAAAEVLVPARTRRQLAAAITWNAMVAIAVILTLAAIALTLAGIFGAEL